MKGDRLVDQPLKTNRKDKLINFKVSIGIIVLLSLIFIAVLINRTNLFSGIYLGSILFLILSINSVIGIIINFSRWKFRKRKYLLFVFHFTMLIASIFVLIMRQVAILYLEVVLEVINEILS